MTTVYRFHPEAPRRLSAVHKNTYLLYTVRVDKKTKVINSLSTAKKLEIQRSERVIHNINRPYYYYYYKYI